VDRLPLALEPQRRNYFRKVTAGDASDVAYWMEVEGQIPGCATAAARSRDFRLRSEMELRPCSHLARGLRFFKYRLRAHDRVVALP
jgi:hypothetical protein